MNRRLACPNPIALWLVAAILLAFNSVVAAEPAVPFGSLPGNLPKTVVPTHYAIELEPDLDKLTIAGTQLVDIEVREPTALIVLNANNLTLNRAAIDNRNASIALDTGAQTATLTFAQPLAVGAHKLRIDFTARINQFRRGLFVVNYQTGAGSRRMIATHLEPADARRVFPCWDEPAFKATFALTVTVPRAFTAVSNMPVVSEEPVTPSLKQVKFATTPKMSSYLFALIAGQFERISGHTDGVAVNVFTTAGKSAQGRVALDAAVDLLRYFNDYFDFKYPLPKLDLIAIPGGGGVAGMENWGAITLSENRVLFDPAVHADSARREIFKLMAHEIAHQWFGNLVTMGWWDNLWLNEGFATWMELKATDHFYPQWQVWLDGNARKQRAMTGDARRTARALEQPVTNESMGIFDATTYTKGQALIRMLENHVGEHAFRAGIRKYMKDHAYGSTTSADLARALEAASGKPVAGIVASFASQAGVPLVRGETACIGDEQRLTLRQEPFTVHEPGAATPRWDIPVTIGPLRALRPAETVLLQDGPKEVAAGRCGEPVKLNFGDVGYFRVDYDDATRLALTRSMALMSPVDRLNLLSDTWALVETGRARPASYFELVDEIGADDSRAIWEQVIRVFSWIDQLQRGSPERAAFQAYARARLRSVFDRLTWEGPDGDDNALLRARLILALGDMADKDIQAEAKKRFDTFLTNPQSLRPGLREPVIHVAGVAADRKTYDALIALGRKSTGNVERTRYYAAAASARDPVLAAETLERTLTDELSADLAIRSISAVAWSGEQPELAWNFVRKHFGALADKRGNYFRDTFVANLMTVFADPERAAEIRDFAPVQTTASGRRAAERAAETIAVNAAFKADKLPAIDAWIKARPARD